MGLKVSIRRLQRFKHNPLGRSDASFVSGGEEISLGHTYLEVPSRYTQDKHLSDKQTPQDEQGAPGQKEISELSVKR